MCELRQDAATGAFTTAFGLYHDRYVLEGSRWWFAERRYHSLARHGGVLDVFPLPGEPGIEVPASTADRARRTGPPVVSGPASATGGAARGSIVPMALLVVRHASAGRRSAYTGDDRDRPLSPRGRAQAEALVPLLAGVPAPADPVQPRRPVLRDGAAPGRGPRPPDRVGGRAGRGERSRRPPAAAADGGGDRGALHPRRRGHELLDALAGDLPAKARDQLRLLKGEVWVVQSTGIGARDRRPHPPEPRRARARRGRTRTGRPLR